MSMKHCDMYNFGYVLADIDADQLQPIRDEVAKIQSNFDHAQGLNYDLAGNIAGQYELSDCHEYLQQLVEPYAQKLWSGTHPLLWFSSYGVTMNKPLLMQKTAWVNFQRPGEFNPVHNHEGLISFVIWLNIPYTQESEQQATADIPAERNMAGKFQFIYSNALGNQVTWNMNVDRSFENKILLFPSKLLHAVYPFHSSTDYRISIAGNLGHDAW